jgi:ERCC4-type nuclease
MGVVYLLPRPLLCQKEGDLMDNKALQLILNNIEIIVDTRENQNFLIMEFFNKNKIPYTIEKLDTGDYSCIVNPVKEIGFAGADFTDAIAIERKSGLVELAGSLSQSRDRFERELQRAKDSNMEFTLLVEDGSFQDIINHRYRTNLNEKSYIATILTFKYRYGISIEFIPKEYAGAWIYRHLYYYARNYFKERAG